MNKLNPRALFVSHGAPTLALDKIPADQRQAINMAFFFGLTQMQIAEQLGEPLGTVKARIRRGLLKLRDYLNGNKL